MSKDFGWFTHDSNGKMCVLIRTLNYFLELNPKIEAKDLWRVKQAVIVAEEQLFMNSILYDGSIDDASLIKLIDLWSRHKHYPKVSLVTIGDREVKNRNQKMYLAGILSELSHNAYKAGAKNVFVAVDTNDITVTDDGPGIPEEIKDKIMEEGFSTFGTSGLGLSYLKQVSEWAGVELELIDTKPTFKITFITKQ